MVNALNPLGQAIINHLQKGFLLVDCPYAEAASRLRTDERTLLEALKEMLEKGQLSRFGPLYNVERMGGAVALAAIKVSADRLSSMVEQVNAFPEVAHNYLRDHLWNLWFVLATETPDGIVSTARAIERDTGHRLYLFPKQREFRIGFHVTVDADHVDAGAVSQDSAGEKGTGFLDPIDRNIVMATQDGMPLVPRPYAVVADRLNLSHETVITRLQRLLRIGAIRRIGAVPNHYGLGLGANGMTVWDVVDDEIESVGAEIGALPYVTHCYQRPRFGAEWPYNFFAMVHGRERGVVEEKRACMARLIGRRSRRDAVLYSKRLLKKTGLRLRPC